MNKTLVEIGSLLHDIGVYKLYTAGKPLLTGEYVTHGILGYQLLKAEGYSEELCRFASHHTGVGITSEDIMRNKLPLPTEDFLAETNEERLVMYADKFHSKDPSRFNSIEWYKNYLASKFGLDKVRLFEEMIKEFGEPPISEMAEKYDQPVRNN